MFSYTKPGFILLSLALDGKGVEYLSRGAAAKFSQTDIALQSLALRSLEGMRRRLFVRANLAYFWLRVENGWIFIARGGVK